MPSFRIRISYRPACGPRAMLLEDDDADQLAKEAGKLAAALTATLLVGTWTGAAADAEVVAMVSVPAEPLSRRLRHGRRTQAEPRRRRCSTATRPGPASRARSQSSQLSRGSPPCSGVCTPAPSATPADAHGDTAKDTPMTCSVSATDDRNRWRQS